MIFNATALKMLPQAVYEIRGFFPTMENVPKVIFPSGDYAVEVVFKKDDAVVARFRGYGSIVHI